MRPARRPFACLRYRRTWGPSPQRRPFHASTRLASWNPSSPSSEPRTTTSTTSTTSTTTSNTPIRATTAPRPNIDIKHIRQNPALYEQTCLERNYKALASYPARIIALHQQWQARQKEGRALRERSNLLRRQIANPASVRDEEMDKEQQEQGQQQQPPLSVSAPTQAAEKTTVITKEQLLEEARTLKASLSSIEQDEARLQAEIQALALALPNLTSDVTPRGHDPALLSYINEPALAANDQGPQASDRVWRSHVHIGTELGILDFAGAATTSGWGWYYLLNEGAQLEHALVSYALATATRSGWGQVSPPSMVYSHIAAACGFQPRENNDNGSGGATQIYTISQAAADRERGRPEYCLAGTAEVPLAGMKADSVLDEGEVPCKHVAVSRCYRAEAGARGADTKGLYRVHEFTKVELFAWTPPDAELATEVFDEMVDMQTEILGSLGLHCRVLEMPSGDLGASAIRKNDIEAWFPSRARRDVSPSSSTNTESDNNNNNNNEEQQVVEGWGEVTSASICTDYQTRRLATRLRDRAGKLVFPWTVNGTAMAVPRVLAAILENGWDEKEGTVTIPEVLRPWMDGRDKIRGKQRNPLRLED